MQDKMQEKILRLKVFHFNRGKPSHNETRLQIQMQATRSPIEKRRKPSKPTECDDFIVVSVSGHFSQLSIKRLNRESGKMLPFLF